MKPQERAKQLASDHWNGYIKGLLEVYGEEHGINLSSIHGYNYITAFCHGYKHAIEDRQAGMFAPPLISDDSGTFKDATAESLCHTCQRNKGCIGDYPRTKDGGCEGYCLPPITVPPPAPLRERILDAKQEAAITPKHPLDCIYSDCKHHTVASLRNCNKYPASAVSMCSDYEALDPFAAISKTKQEAPTAAEQTATHTDPSTTCRDCGNSLCTGIGRNLTCDQGCERFTPKEAAL